MFFLLVLHIIYHRVNSVFNKILRFYPSYKWWIQDTVNSFGPRIIMVCYSNTILFLTNYNVQNSFFFKLWFINLCTVIHQIIHL